MLTLNPVAFLVIYIALAITPANSQIVTIDFGPSMHMEFHKEADGSWSKADDAGNVTSWKREGTKLLIRSQEGNDSRSYDLASFFQINGKEDWTHPRVVYPQKNDRDQISTKPGTKLLSVTIQMEGKIQNATIRW